MRVGFFMPKRKSVHNPRNRAVQPLPDDVKNNILTFAGQFKKPLEISDLIRKEHPAAFYSDKNYRLTTRIEQIIYKNKEYVFALKEQYSKAIMEVPIAHKRIRLERLESLYDEASKKPSERRELLKAAREELEGVRVNLNMYQMNFFGGISDVELAQREREIIDRVQSLAGGKGAENKEEGVSLLPATSEAEVVSSV